MHARQFTRIAIPTAAACAIAATMVFSVSRTLAYTPPETVLTRAIVIDAISTGMTVDAIATSGATPSQVATLLEAVRSTNSELQSAVAAAASVKIASQNHESVVGQIRAMGLTDQLDTDRADTATALAQAQTSLETAKQAWVTALEADLNGTVSSALIQRLVNATLNRSRKVPPSLRVLEPETTDWDALELAWKELDAVMVAELPIELRTPWQAAIANPSVVAADADYQANIDAIRTAFVQVVQLLPTE